MTTGCALGIDLERLRSISRYRGDRGPLFLSGGSRGDPSAGASRARPGVLPGWTRKEAYIKAIGDGLSCPLDSFQVTIQADMPARLVHIADDRAAAARWTLHDFSLAPDERLAL